MVWPAGYRRSRSRLWAVGVNGCHNNGIPASSGVRSPLIQLSSSHAATVFSQAVGPPRDLGRTWSAVVALNWPPVPHQQGVLGVDRDPVGEPAHVLLHRAVECGGPAGALAIPESFGNVPAQQQDARGRCAREHAGAFLNDIGHATPQHRVGVPDGHVVQGRVGRVQNSNEHGGAPFDA